MAFCYNSPDGLRHHSKINFLWGFPVFGSLFITDLGLNSEVSTCRFLLDKDVNNFYTIGKISQNVII